MSKNTFFEGIQQNIGDNDALIYIHGFDNSFDDAIIRAGQIGYDLNPNLLTVSFSWPSKGKKLCYTHDEASIEASEKYIVEFLEDFTKNINPEKIHIIAHSMGNRGLLRAFNEFLKKPNNFKFGQIILAAPDIDRDIFKELAKVYPIYSTRTTLYISKKDRALWLSKMFHSHPRTGLLPPITIVDNIDTIEVTRIDISLLGHGYIAEAKELLQDIFYLIENNTPPNKRFGLRKVPNFNYWKFCE